MQRCARKRCPRSERGQVTVMIAILMVTLLFMMAFAVNVGMLVHAKINLQNAADLAAYAGAATQARQLNSISFLNYEMRQQYKRFLYRYYVIGNLAQPPFPRSAGGRARYRFRPNTPTDFLYNAPAICVTFQANDNACQVSQLQPIQIPPANPIDQISTVLNAQLTEIERARRLSCGNIGRMNEALATFWLYNTDPTLETVAQTLERTSSTQARSAMTTLRGLARGLGIVPKLFLLRRRIQTLAEYINLPAVEGIQYDRVSSMQGEGDAAKNERIIQAYLSAYHTLGEHLFDADSIEMTELMQTPQIRLEEQRATFDIYAVGMREEPAGGRAQEGTCTQYPVPYSVENVPVAVYKSPRFLTYYALRLKAKARLLFNPFGSDLEMTAYSSAQPFGSRIGPKPPMLSDMAFSLPVEPPVASCVMGAGDADPTGPGEAQRRYNQCKNRIPALHVLEDAGPEVWQTELMLGALHEATRGASGTEPINLDALNRGMQAALTPNPWEGGKYNIPGGLADNDPFVQYFGPSNTMAIWAPLYEGNNAAELESLIQEFMQQARSIVPRNLTPEDKDAMVRGFIAGFTQYLTLLQQDRGESDRPGAPGENIKFYRMSNPYAGGTGSSQITLTDPARTKSSWNEVHNDTFKAAGRTGYSVKFVALKHLSNPGEMTSDGSETWENRPIEDSESEAIYERIQH